MLKDAVKMTLASGAAQRPVGIMADLPTAPPTWSELRPVATLLPLMAEIRNHIAGNAHGITRDEVIVGELVKLLHAKTHDEQQLRAGRPGRFFVLRGESAASVKRRTAGLLKAARGAMAGIRTPRPTLSHQDRLLLDEASVAFAVGRLQHLALLSADRDVLGEAFESLIGPSLRGADGQFFTPLNLVQMCVAMMSPEPHERVIDPACGAGGFLAEVLRCWQETRLEHATPGALVGIDKDAFLATLCADRLALFGHTPAVFCDNALEQPVQWSGPLQAAAPLGSFDVVLTNPPFGAAIPVKGEALLRQYDLARKWKRASKAGAWQQTSLLLPPRPPQVLFIERCLQLLRPGGRAALVLPEGIFGNESEGYLRYWVGRHAELLAIVDCPLETFLPSTPTKTCVLFLRKKHSQHPGEEPPVFLAIAEHCGHDRRGKPLLRPDGSRLDDFPAIAAAYRGGPGAGP